MRPRNQQARDLLPNLLRRTPGTKAAQLAEWVKLSQPTISRILSELGPQVVAVGRGARRRYFWRRPLRGQTESLPVYEVDTAGNAREVSSLELTSPEGCVMDVAGLGWPVDAEFRDGHWPGLPYPLQDMRPQGFLGRGFARQHAADLAVSANPNEWSDDDALSVLSQRGSDTSGNLIVGEGALNRWLEEKRSPQPIIPANVLAREYEEMANRAAAMGPVGSSAAGEFPKFTALRELDGSATPHVIVKFSGAERSGAVRRWADLLVCEHLALQCARSISGVSSADSRIVIAGERTMLEVERFDRHGLFGRSPLCSLDTIDAALLGSTSQDWTLLADAIVEQGWLDIESALTIRRIWWYGKLIGNTDMHKGNLSFVPGELRLKVAPVYDMLPMVYAPMAGGEIPKVTFTPILPTPPAREVWLVACSAALEFWDAASQDPRISAHFRAICRDNYTELLRLRALA